MYIKQLFISFILQIHKQSFILQMQKQSIILQMHKQSFSSFIHDIHSAGIRDSLLQRHFHNKIQIPGSLTQHLCCDVAVLEFTPHGMQHGTGCLGLLCLVPVRTS